MDVIIAAVSAALMGICWSLWQRRITWTCPWERIMTLSVTFQGVGMALASPLGYPLGRRMHAAVGLCGLPQLVGNVLMIGATGAFAYTTLSRAVSPNLRDWIAPRFIRLPSASAAFFLIVDYLHSGIHTRPHELYSSHPTSSVVAYWIVWSGVLLYLLAGASLGLMLVRRTARHRPIADLYLLACACGIASLLVWSAAQFLPAEYHACLVAAWVLFSLWGAVFTLAAAKSWRRKVQPFQPLLQAVRT